MLESPSSVHLQTSPIFRCVCCSFQGRYITQKIQTLDLWPRTQDPSHLPGSLFPPRVKAGRGTSANTRNLSSQIGLHLLEARVWKKLRNSLNRLSRRDAFSCCGRAKRGCGKKGYWLKVTPSKHRPFERSVLQSQKWEKFRDAPMLPEYISTTSHLPKTAAALKKKNNTMIQRYQKTRPKHSRRKNSAKAPRDWFSKGRWQCHQRCGRGRCVGWGRPPKFKRVRIFSSLGLAGHLFSEIWRTQFHTKKRSILYIYIHKYNIHQNRYIYDIIVTMAWNNETINVSSARFFVTIKTRVWRFSPWQPQKSCFRFML